MRKKLKRNDKQAAIRRYRREKGITKRECPVCENTYVMDRCSFRTHVLACLQQFEHKVQRYHFQARIIGEERLKEKRRAIRQNKLFS